MKQCTALALDTSSSMTFVAVRDSAGKVFQSVGHDSANHSEQLSNLIVATLEQASLRAQELEKLVVGAGPGSFTGLRIGFSFMKGLASSISRPLCSVSSLAGAAFEFLESGRLVASISDARRDQLFCQLLWLSKSGKPETDGPASILEVGDFWLHLESAAKRRGLEASALAVYVDSNLSFLKEGKSVSPRSIGRSLLELAENEEFVSPAKHEDVFDVMALAELEPNYVRAVAAKTIAERRQ